jgi:predicted transcriptional regulator of viral defense system
LFLSNKIIINIQKLYINKNSLQERDFMRILQGLALPVFSTNDIIRILGKDENYTNLYIHRLVSRGVLNRVEKGKYCFVNEDPLKIASNLLYPSYISFLTALSYYNLTTQIPIEIQVVSYKQKKPLSYENQKIAFIKFKKNNIFGFRRDDGLLIAEPEKAIVDGIYLPKYLPITEIYSALQEGDFNHEKLVNYIVSIESNVAMKRLGFILESLQIPNYAKLTGKINKKYDLLNPELPVTGVKNSKWRLIINEVFE